ncbi:hypothetical protein BH24CHL5_BH24CHL5_00630 [soil metagenome]
MSLEQRSQPPRWMPFVLLLAIAAGVYAALWLFGAGT